MKSKRLCGVLGLSKHCGLLTESIGLIEGGAGDVTQPVVSLTLMEEPVCQSFSSCWHHSTIAHRRDAVMVPLCAAGGYYERCQGVLKPYSQMDKMAKDSSLLSALCLSLLPGRGWYPGPLTRTVSRR